MQYKFNKVLAKYYEIWYRNACNSVLYCLERGQVEKALEYKVKATEYFNTINEHWDEIDFYRIGNNAFYNKSATEIKWKQYFNKS